jgi:hypothetical protein
MDCLTMPSIPEWKRINDMRVGLAGASRNEHACGLRLADAQKRAARVEPTVEEVGFLARVRGAFD